MTGSEFLHVPDIVVGLHPRAVDFINIVPELLWFEAKAVPYRLDQDVNLEFLAQRNAFADLLDRAGPDVLVGLVFAPDFAGNEQNGSSTDCLGFAHGVFQPFTAGFAGFLLG